MTEVLGSVFQAGHVAVGALRFRVRPQHSSAGGSVPNRSGQVGTLSANLSTNIVRLRERVVRACPSVRSAGAINDAAFIIIRDVFASAAGWSAPGRLAPVA